VVGVHISFPSGVPVIRVLNLTTRIVEVVVL